MAKKLPERLIKSVRRIGCKFERLSDALLKRLAIFDGGEQPDRALAPILLRRRR